MARAASGPDMRGICMSSRTRSKCSAATARTASSPSSTVTTSAPSACSSASATRRFTSLSSATSTRTTRRGAVRGSGRVQPAGAGCVTGTAAGASPVPPGRSTTTVNSEPVPGRLTTSIRPPMSPTICWLRARPRPVPPKRAPWAPCTKGRKSRWISSASMPAPVSETDEPQPRGRRGGVAVDADGDVHLSALGELQRVADEVHDHLAQPHRVADEDAVVTALDRQVEALAPGDGQQGGDHLGGDVGRPERALGQGHRGGLGLGQVQDVVEQLEQRLPRAAGQGDELGLPGAELLEPERLEHAQDAVERRADLVAGGGQEARSWRGWRPAPGRGRPRARGPAGPARTARRPARRGPRARRAGRGRASRAPRRRRTACRAPARRGAASARWRTAGRCPGGRPPRGCRRRRARGWRRGRGAAGARAWPARTSSRRARTATPGKPISPTWCWKHSSRRLTTAWGTPQTVAATRVTARSCSAGAPSGSPYSRSSALLGADARRGAAVTPPVVGTSGPPLERPAGPGSGDARSGEVTGAASETSTGGGGGGGVRVIAVSGKTKR